jgi:hypothetical protein
MVLPSNVHRPHEAPQPIRAGRPTDVHVGPGRYTRNDRGAAPATIEEFMYRVARRPLSKLVALLPAAEPPPTFEELEHNLSRSCLPVSLRQNASGSRIRALLQEPSGTLRFDVEVNATEFLPNYLELARFRGADFDAALASQFFLSVSCKLGCDVLITADDRGALLTTAFAPINAARACV